MRKLARRGSTSTGTGAQQKECGARGFETPQRVVEIREAKTKQRNKQMELNYCSCIVCVLCEKWKMHKFAFTIQTGIRTQRMVEIFVRTYQSCCRRPHGYCCHHDYHFYYPLFQRFVSLSCIYSTLTNVVPCSAIFFPAIISTPYC